MSQDPPPVFLMTDFGLEDPYVGLVKAKILDRSPDASIVDLTHEITPQDEMEAVFLLEYCLPDIPEESIITIVVDPEVGTSRDILAARISGDRIVIVPDTGIVSGLDIRESYQVTNEDLARKPISKTFHGRDWFGPVAGYLSGGGSLENVGPKTSPVLSDKGIPEPQSGTDELTGQVVYVDHFGNLITNITDRDFQKFVSKTGNDNPEVVIDDTAISGIEETYEDGTEDVIALFGSFDRLEVARPGGSARESLNVGRNEEVMVHA